MKLSHLVLIGFTIILNASCHQAKSPISVDNKDSLFVLPVSLASIYEEFDVKGCFVAKNMNTGIWYVFDTLSAHVQTTPASTFKIFNSLVGLETQAISSVDDTLTWDGIKRDIESWNHDQSLREAFRNSTVWYYQNLAVRIGEARMHYWIDTVGYGNKDISGGISQFWLTGNLKISPVEQVVLLERLYNDKLPFSQRSMTLVKEIMILEGDSNLILSAKTGWGYQDGTDIGWFVGSALDHKGARWIFANRIETSDEPREDFARARIITAKSFLNFLLGLP